MKKKILFTTLIIAAGLILPLILVYAGATIDEPSDASNRMPTIISGSGNDQVTNAAPSAEEGNIAKLVQYIYTFAMLAAGLAVIGGLIYGGVRYLFAGGSITKMFVARGQVRNALYGLGLILISYLILYTINPALVNLVNPTADPLNLKTGSIWSLNSSYGMMLGNTPVGKPCVRDSDCNYDSDCCPAESGGNRASSCRQNFTDQGNPDTKTSLKTDVPPKNDPWFKCGWTEASWYLVGSDSTCPNTFQEAFPCSKDNPQNCCDPADISQKYIPPDKKTICCRAPNMIIAKDKAECDFLFGKGGDDPATPDVTENRKNKNSQCLDAAGCVPGVATCQTIWPYPKDEKKVVSKWLNTESTVNDKYGDPCQMNFPQFLTTDWAKHILGIGAVPRDTCQDSRLICNSSPKIRKCIEAQSVGGPCDDDSDCCQSQYWWMVSSCEKYISRDISLKCNKNKGNDQEPGYCTFKSAADESKIDQGGGDETGGTGDGLECTFAPANIVTCQDLGYSSTTGCTTTPPTGQICCCRPRGTGNCTGSRCPNTGLNICAANSTANCCETDVSFYDTDVAAAANGNSICPNVDTAKLIKAIMSQESCGKIGLTSSDGVSAGLMQIKPETARSFQDACDASGKTITLEWLKKPENAQKQICMAIEYLKTLVSSCGCDVRHLAAGYNGGGAALGACAASTNCGPAAATDRGQCLMCSNETFTRRWECLWDDNKHTTCNYDNSGGSFKYTRAYVPKVLSCYNQF